jgi:hypothetical protein
LYPSYEAQARKITAITTKVNERPVLVASDNALHPNGTMYNVVDTIIKNENPFPTSSVSSTNPSSYAHDGNGGVNATIIPSSSPGSKPRLTHYTPTRQGSPKSCDVSLGLSCFQQGLTNGWLNGAGDAQI